MQPESTAPLQQESVDRWRHGASLVHDNDRPAVLGIHGLTGTPWELHPTLEALHQAGHSVYAPLLPGHGTTPEQLSQTTWHDWSSFVLEQTTELLQKHSSVVLLGKSLGSLLVTNAAAHFDGRGVVGLVTMSCALRISPFFHRGLSALRYLGPRMPNWYWKKQNGSDVQSNTARAMNPAYPVHSLRAAREIPYAQAVVREKLQRIHMPLLAMHGTLDQTTPVKASLDLLGGVRSARASLVLLPQSGHVLAVDVEREAVARRVCGFVRSL